MTSIGAPSPQLSLLLCGNGINFQQRDLALSTMVLVRSRGADGKQVRTVIDTGHIGMRRNILEALVKHGVAAEEINFVCLTHVHRDHVHNLDLFTNARIVLSRKEWDSIQGEAPRDLITPAWTKHLLAGAHVTLVEPGDNVVPGVEFIDAAGHSAGCLAFAIRLGEETAIVTGDAVP
jgi:N-acyl homoserine lactone hydrolase